MARGKDGGGKPRRFAKKALVGCVILPLLICAFGGFFLVNQINARANQLPKELAKLKAMGVPTEGADLARNVPDADNAAKIYGSLSYQLEALEADKSQEPLVKLLDTYATSKTQTEDLPKVITALQEKQPIFNEAAKLLGKPRLDFKRDYQLGFNATYSEYDQFRRLAKWQCTRALVQWKTSSRDDALKSLAGAFLVANHASQEPVLIAQLVGIACHSVAHKTAEQIIGEARNDPAMLKKIEGIIEKTNAVADVSHAFGGEIVLGRYAIQGLRKPSDLALGPRKERSTGNALLDQMLGNGGIRTMYEAKWCEAWRIAFEKFRDVKNDWLGTHKVLQELEANIQADTSLENTMNRLLFPVLVQSHEASGKQVAQHRLELLSLKLLQMRSKGLPADLKTFGEIGIDPFTGKPMGYERKGKGFRVWSVGIKTNGGEIPMAFDF